MRRTFARNLGWLLLALISLSCLAVSSAISLAIRLPASNEFNIVRWEMRNVPGKWLYLAGRFFEGELSPSEQDRGLGRYLALTGEIERLERTPRDGDDSRRSELTRLRAERGALENDTEAMIEGRLTAVLEDAGIASSVPLFPGARWVFPPVDVEFDEPPYSLAVSPRDRIELVERRPLRPRLPVREAIEVEDAVERDGVSSALVSRLAGAATYPSIVGPRGEYAQLVETVAHEWVHHYLFFKPLGRRYYASLELQTLNETVADLAARDLASLVVDRYPLVDRAGSESGESSSGEPAADVDGFLRRLRLDVEELLAAGKIEEAEVLMEQRRAELAEQGVVFRKINQAFFATRGVYATAPGSIDPLGRKLQALRERAGSVGAFLRDASGLRSGADLDALLEGG